MSSRLMIRRLSGIRLNLDGLDQWAQTFDRLSANAMDARQLLHRIEWACLEDGLSQCRPNARQ